MAGCSRRKWSGPLAEHERTLTVFAGADAAFDFLADPIHLPEYVSTMRLEDSTAVEGELDPDADLAERAGAPDAGFVADRATRRITWGRPGADYGGSMTVEPGTSSSCTVTIRLRTRDDADADEVARIVDQAVSSLRRLLVRR